MPNRRDNPLYVVDKSGVCQSLVIKPILTQKARTTTRRNAPRLVGLYWRRGHHSRCDGRRDVLYTNRLARRLTRALGLPVTHCPLILSYSTAHRPLFVKASFPHASVQAQTPSLRFVVDVVVPVKQMHKKRARRRVGPMRHRACCVD